MRILVYLTLLLSGCFVSQADEDKRPNILWIVAEDISPFFGCYGDPDASTPHIDAFAKGAHLFRNAFSTAPICAPSRSSLATGMYATSLGTQNLRSEVKIPERIVPLAQILREHGYWTALRGKTDYNFDPEGIFNYWEQDTAPWTHCPDGKPFFAFMNLGSTHEGSGNISERAAPALERLPEGRIHKPESVNLPPYFPDRPEMRRIWARYYDLISVWDIDVQSVLDDLEASGEAEDTIVFLMADHGLGLPRYKRWLYKTGLHVPLIVHIPEKFRKFSPDEKAATVEERLVSYVDLPATALALAGIDAPERFQGQTLFAEVSKEVVHRRYVFGARDRADDMYDLSRSVFDGRYMYIRHFLPHLPAMQEGIIFSPSKKESLIELHRVHDAGEDSRYSKALWEPRPFEELYDLENDPRELNNLANDSSLASVKQGLSSELKKWILETRDSAFLMEPEMHRRANASDLTPYEMAQDEELYPLEAIFLAAEAASQSGGYSESGLTHSDPGVRFWNLTGVIISAKGGPASRALFARALEDGNAVVRATAAEGLGRMGEMELAVPTFRALLRETEPNLGLFVARSLAVSSEELGPLEVDIRAARQRYLAPPGSPRPWKDFMYSAFTSWALEWGLIKMGSNEYSDFNN